MRFFVILCMLLASPAFAGEKSPPKKDVLLDQFVAVCSTTKKISKEGATEREVNIANCLGRMRGFVEGHMATTELADAMKKNGILGNLQLWCVPDTFEERDLVVAVLSWIQKNQKDFEVATKEPAGALKIVMQAMNKTYPCVKGNPL